LSKIALGEWNDGGTVKLDLPRLLVTRMLIQANSGGGKSWALRGLLERTAGQVQQLIVDPEGEFPSLREKHDLVIIAAAGGDATAHPRTAGLLAHRLLETEASAVLDISELKAHDRHAFVRIFFESLIDAPKGLRHPVLVALDEAQLFAPEKGQGESEASAAVIDIATRGRKRGLCLVAATQRISMFHKGVAAELKNRMIGGTSLDVDVKRAAFDLGMPAKDALTALRALEPGHFFAFGPSFGQVEPREFITGEIQTSHPKVGNRQNIAPPKPTAAILALLPKLADLPREAEERARSMDDLKKELAQARRELSIAKKQQPAAPVVKADPAAVTKLRDQARSAAASVKQLKQILGELMKFVIKINAEGFKSAEATEAIKTAIDAGMASALKQIEASAAKRNALIERLQAEGQRLLERAQQLAQAETVEIEVTAARNDPFTVKPGRLLSDAESAHNLERLRASKPLKERVQHTNGSSANLPPGERATLTALIQYPEGLQRGQLTVLTQYKRSSRDAYIQRLREKGFVETAGDTVKATEVGILALPDAEPLPTGVELQEHWLRELPSGEAKVLQVLIAAYPGAVGREALSEQTGFARSSRDAYLQRMKAKQLWTEPSRGEVRASEDLF
jgi:Helicase HerA, central domain